MANILDLEPQDFTNALDELGVKGGERDGLIRQYQERHSPMSGLYGYLDRSQQALSGRGMERNSMLPTARPQGTSLIDALKTGDWQFAMPSSAVDLLRGSMRGVDAPAATARGMPYTPDQMSQDAIAAAGVAMVGGGASPSPAGAMRSNMPSWFGKKTHHMTVPEYEAYYASPNEVKTLATHAADAISANPDVVGLKNILWDKFESTYPKTAAKAKHVDLDTDPVDVELDTLDDIQDFPVEDTPDKPSWWGKTYENMNDKEKSAFVNADGATVDQHYAELEASKPKPSGKPSWFGKMEDDMTDPEFEDFTAHKYNASPDFIAHHEAFHGVPPKPSWFGKHYADMTDEEQTHYMSLPSSDHILTQHFNALDAASAAKHSTVKPAPAVDEDGLVDLDSIDWEAEPEPLAPPPMDIKIDMPSAPPAWLGKHVNDMTPTEYFQFMKAGSPVSGPSHMIGDTAGKSIHQDQLPSWVGKPMSKMTPEENEGWFNNVDNYLDDFHGAIKHKTFDGPPTIENFQNYVKTVKGAADDGLAAKSSTELPDANKAELDHLFGKLQGNGGVRAPQTKEQIKAVEIAEKLRKGQAKTITEEEFAAADPVYLRELYDAGQTGMDLPMDFDTRMERAAAAGFNTGKPLYRGRGTSRDFVSEDRNVFTSDEPSVAAGYVRDQPDKKGDTGNMMKLVARNGSKMPEIRPPRGTTWSSMESGHPVHMPDGTVTTAGKFMESANGSYPHYNISTDDLGEAANKLGLPGFKFRGIRDSGSGTLDWAYKDKGKTASSVSSVRVDSPGSNNLRLQTANFDPRLDHLRNFSAANASPATGVAALAQEEDDASGRLMRYLEALNSRR